LKKTSKLAAFDCEYLVGDDSCKAIRESDMGAFRAEACHNEVKDACCYSCSLREQCDISCDLPEQQKPDKEQENSQHSEKVALSEAPPGMKCCDCRYYLKPECPRGYSRDTELWRRQDPCEELQPSKKQTK
jgi:hypothetical protein